MYFGLFMLTLISVSVAELADERYQKANTDEDLDLDYGWFASNSSLKHNRTSILNERHKAVALLVRNQLKKELRKLKSTMTDSILEEVISYYGKRLDGADALKNEVETLSKRVTMLSQNLNTLGHNFKTISKSHRNLVDLVRNNIAVAGKSTTAGPVSRVNNSNLKKKSVDSINHTGTNSSEAKLKQELLNDLETKYSNLLNDRLVEIIIKNFKSNESAATTSPAAVVHHSIDTTRENKMDGFKSSDCQDLRNEGFLKDGIYKITVDGNKSFNVYCEFQDNIGWTLLQRRFDGSVDFYQNWNAYKKGFGNLIGDGEFWLGLENMHDLTRQRNYSLEIVMTDWKNEEYTASYARFKVDSEPNKYRLELGAYLSNISTAGDSLGAGKGVDSRENPSSGSHSSLTSSLTQSHNNMPFSTFDSDNDMRFYDNCAQIFKSGWWFNACFQANLNGVYYKYSGGKNPRLVKKEENAQLKFLRNGIHWNSIDFYKSLKSTKLRLRRAGV